MNVLPPGTLLQLMYFKEHLEKLVPGHFIEVGPGMGELTARLLKAGWVGTVFDLEKKTIRGIEERFSREISNKHLKVILGDYLDHNGDNDADLIISSMVMEHLDESQELQFMDVSFRHLNSHGRMIGLVPASPKHWGIEDDIAGHFRRYTRHKIYQLLDQCGWKVEHVAGLTYPISNILLPISDILVRRSELSKLRLSNFEKTKQSGCRKVMFKTNFPPVFRVFINEFVLLPLHWVQKLFSGSENALVLYFEAVPVKE